MQQTHKENSATGNKQQATSCCLPKISQIPFSFFQSQMQVDFAADFFGILISSKQVLLNIYLDILNSYFLSHLFSLVNRDFVVVFFYLLNWWIPIIISLFLFLSLYFFEGYWCLSKGVSACCCFCFAFCIQYLKFFHSVF